LERENTRTAIRLMEFVWYLGTGAAALLGVLTLAGGQIGQGLLVLFVALLQIPPGIVVLGLCRMFCDIHEHFIPQAAPKLPRPLTPRQAHESRTKADAVKEERAMQHLRKLGKPIDE